MKKQLTLKEVFFKEEMGQQSRFVESMRKQFSRAQTQEDLNYIAKAYDQILQLASNPDPNKRQEVLKSADPFFKFHFRLAYSDLQNGTLDVNSIPSGKQMLDTEIEKRRASEAETLASREKEVSRHANLTPQQKADMERQAQYGLGNTDPYRGLGS